MNRRPAPTALLAALLATLLAAGGAQAQKSPYYIGVIQDFTHESNVFNADSAQRQSDTISTTTLRGGIDQPFGRQRFFANASLNHRRYSDNGGLNNNGYGLNVGLDWSTIERLSGSLVVNANQQLSRFNAGVIVPVTLRNVERSEDVDAKVRYGVVADLALEGGLGYRQVSFSAPEYAAREYRQDRANLGLSYRAGGALTLGGGVSGDQTRYRAAATGQSAPDSSQRRDLYLTANWVPTGASSVNARVNFGKIEYDRATAADFSGVTGSLTWLWKPTGKLQFATTLSRDAGQESGFIRVVDFQNRNPILPNASDFSRVTNVLGVRAAYELTAKIDLDAGLNYARRNLVDGVTGASGTDNTTAFSVGARWAALRTLVVGCNASHSSRTASGFGSSEYEGTAFGCFGSFTLD